MKSSISSLAAAVDELRSSDASLAAEVGSVGTGSSSETPADVGEALGNPKGLPSWWQEAPVGLELPVNAYVHDNGRDDGSGLYSLVLIVPAQGDASQGEEAWLRLQRGADGVNGCHLDSEIPPDDSVHGGSGLEFSCDIPPASPGGEGGVATIRLTTLTGPAADLQRFADDAGVYGIIIDVSVEFIG